MARASPASATAPTRRAASSGSCAWKRAWAMAGYDLVVDELDVEQDQRVRRLGDLR
jgi:hypothetical protein